MDQTKKLCVELYYSKQIPAKTLYPHFSGACITFEEENPE